MITRDSASFLSGILQNLRMCPNQSSTCSSTRNWIRNEGINGFAYRMFLDFDETQQAKTKGCC